MVAEADPSARAPLLSMSMDVFLVPAGPSRYALYCEGAITTGDEHDAAAATWWGRMKASFRRAIDEGEAEARGAAEGESRGRLRRFITRKIAEAVAEGRLLWRLRGERAATLVHPDTIDGAAALAIARAELSVDYARHRRWLIIDGLITVITGPLFFFVPGPNLISWYFSFRAVGHFFSMRGARQGLSVIAFTTRSSPHLSAVAAALDGDPAVRAAKVAEAAAALDLERLPHFIERIAM
jgi:hypothetical protein